MDIIMSYLFANLLGTSFGLYDNKTSSFEIVASYMPLKAPIWVK